MSIFKNTRRIIDQIVQKRLSPPPLKMADCHKNALKNGDLKINQYGNVGFEGSRIVKTKITHQPISQPRVSSIIAHNTNISSRIYYEKILKEKNMLEKEMTAVYSINNAENLDRRQQLRKKVPKKNIVSQNVRHKYVITPHNHVMAPNEGTVSQELRANRNQVIYHRVFNVPDEQRHTSLKPFKNVTWFAKKGDESKGISKPGRIGKMSSTNESEFFYKTDREKLLELKKKLKDKEKGPDAPKKMG